MLIFIMKCGPQLNKFGYNIEAIPYIKETSVLLIRFDPVSMETISYFWWFHHTAIPIVAHCI